MLYLFRPPGGFVSEHMMWSKQNETQTVQLHMRFLPCFLDFEHRFVQLFNRTCIDQACVTCNMEPIHRRPICESNVLLYTYIHVQIFDVQTESITELTTIAWLSQLTLIPFFVLVFVGRFRSIVSYIYFTTPVLTFLFRRHQCRGL